MMKKMIAILLMAVVVLSLTGCSGFGYVYTDSNRYTSGNASIRDRVEALDISWLSGSVRVEYHNSDRIELSEESQRRLSEDTRLHWYLDGSTLMVKYAASGAHTLSNLNKQLTVLLPEALKLDDVKIAVSSAEVEADGLNADDIYVATASGRVALRQQGKADTIKLDSASGAVALAVENADTLRVNTASGDVVVDAARLENVEVNSASGKTIMKFAQEPRKIDVDTASGNVTLYMPATAGFTVDLDSISGRVGGNMKLEKVDDDTYRYGDGSCRIEVDSASGSINMEENKDAELSI